ncbi:hypothetical protein [Zhongshania aquimaris]|uniref:Uncharacterized protein n=1 Tax=Zhongshania aquimaris TaxID=2857107 RepID=A0ABS6VTP0_9GAMM|nr:hypothetical protein [Zhongshania aquimaris]MBW2941689.1 hypothetical protein [Zhongshania aquimaris]
MANDKGPLLGELEELKAVLRKQRGVDLSAIPLLDDIIDDLSPSFDDSNISDHSTDSDYGELSEYITDGVEIDEFVATSVTPSYELNYESNYRNDGNYEREIFMQEVIDSMMPEIEAQLRRRLLSLDETILERWYSQLRHDK